MVLMRRMMWCWLIEGCDVSVSRFECVFDRFNACSIRASLPSAFQFNKT